MSVATPKLKRWRSEGLVLQLIQNKAVNANRMPRGIAHRIGRTWTTGLCLLDNSSRKGRRDLAQFTAGPISINCHVVSPQPLVARMEATRSGAHIQ